MKKLKDTILIKQDEFIDVFTRVLFRQEEADDLTEEEIAHMTQMKVMIGLMIMQEVAKELFGKKD